MTIWKYTLKLVDHQRVAMPSGAIALSVGMQEDRLTLWALVDPKADCHLGRDFYVVGTGNPMPVEPTMYIGTVQERAFVWHVFQEKP